MKKSIEALLIFGYDKISAHNIVKQYALCNLKDEILANNIKKVFLLLISLGYTKEEVIKMTKVLPSLYGYSEQKIINKIDFLISLGYTKEEVIKMTKALPSLYGLSEENIREKIEYLKKIGLGFVIMDDTKKLMQSVKLTYARYEFFKNERNELITEDNYNKLFYGEKQFKKQYGIDKKTILERYPYEDPIKELNKTKK